MLAGTNKHGSQKGSRLFFQDCLIMEQKKAQLQHISEQELDFKVREEL